MPRSLDPVLQGGLPQPRVGLERGVEGNRAARRRITRYAAFHAHGGHHRGGPAVFSAAIPGPAARSRRSRGLGLPGSSGRGCKRMQLHIRHMTRYRYERPVKYSVQSLHLTPRRDAGQRALTWTITAPGRRLEQIDAHGNIAHLLTIEQPHREIQIVVRGVVETADTEGRQDDGPLSPLAYLAPTALTAQNEEIKTFAREAIELATTPRARAEALAEAVVQRGALQAGRERRAGHRGGGAQERRRGVPGSRPCVHRRGALDRHAGALRERLPVHRRLERRREPCLGRCVARRRDRVAERGRDAPAARRSATTAASRWGATTSTPRRCAACATAAAARKWRRTCWWRSRPSSSNSEVEFRP